MEQIRSIILAVTVIALLLIVGLRPSPRGWTEQGGPTATPTVQGD